MNRLTKITALLLGLAWSSAFADEANVLRTEVAKPAQAAQQLLKDQKYRDALDKLHDADAISGKTPYETLVIEQLRLIAATKVGDGVTAGKAYDALAATGRLTAAQQQQYTLAVASTFYQLKDFPSAATWGKRYVTEGGHDPQAWVLTAQSYYQIGDYAQTAKTIQDEIKTGDAVPENHYLMLVSSYSQLKDTANYTGALEKLVVAYPKPEHWTNLLHGVESRPGYSDRLGLDLGRLQQAVGLIKTTEQFVELAELALQAGLPGEAKAIIDDGYARGLLGTGADAERHKRLKDAADKKVAAEKPTLPQEETEALAAKDGNALVAAGLAYLSYGQPDKAAQLIGQGIERGGLKRLDDARLHQGVALLRAGQKAKAVEALRAVQGDDGTADLARLWIIQSKAG